MIPYHVNMLYIFTGQQQQHLLEAWHANRHGFKDLAGLRIESGGMVVVILDDYEPGHVTKAMQIIADILDGLDTQPIKPFIPGGKD